jgi:3-(3-hydroxy-phenyl)propionate hydroxylase
VIPVLVVGGGPTGLVAALLLRGYGVGCAVVERYAEPYALPRAVHLDDEVCRILQQVGVADGFAAISRAADGMRLLDAGHRTMAEFARLADGPHGYPQANLFDQPDLERLLRTALTAPSTKDGPQGTVALRAGTELLRLEQPGDGPVRALLRDAGGERWEEVSAVLGCDGANSTVREAIGARLVDLGFRERWLVVDARCDPRRAATFMRIGPDRYRWEFRLAPTETAADLSADLPTLLAPWTGTVPVDVVRQAEYTFTAQVADRWRDRRVFLLGDAAHQTPPFIGQGLGSGLRDAANLTWKLARALNNPAHPDLLDTYRSEREPHARRMIRAAVLAGWAMTGGQDKAATARRVTLAGLARLPGFTTITQHTLSPRLDRGPLVRRTPLLPTGLAGCLLPQPWVTVSRRGTRMENGEGDCGRVALGEPVRLDHVLGDGFAVLVRGGIGSGLVGLARRLDARIVALGEDVEGSDDADVVLASDGGLGRWLGRAGAALVRPDRVVLATGRPGPRAEADLCRAVEPWLPTPRPGIT